MSTSNELLLSESLYPDPDASEELSAPGAESIADEELTGCRLLIVRNIVEPIDKHESAAAVIQLSCTFQPADGCRFSFAQLYLKLELPEGKNIIDLAPKVVDDQNPVEMTLTKKGKLDLKSLSIPVEPGFEISSEKKYSKYHCKVQGSGQGTKTARWDFRENPDKKDGIGLEQVLTFTLPPVETVKGNLVVSARVVKPGLKGTLERIREIVLGSKQEERRRPFSFDIPVKSDESKLKKFFHLFS